MDWIGQGVLYAVLCLFFGETAVHYGSCAPTVSTGKAAFLLEAGQRFGRAEYHHILTFLMCLFRSSLK